MTAATQVQWRVQIKAGTGNWIHQGLYETRANARLRAWFLRQKLGFGNTRVVRYVKAKKGQGK